MDIKEYDAKIDALIKNMDNAKTLLEYKQAHEILCKFQYDEMKKFHEEYKAINFSDHEKDGEIMIEKFHYKYHSDIILEMIDDIVFVSESGFSCVSCIPAKLVEGLENAISEVLSEMLLDLTINPMEDGDGEWYVDATFAGKYVPSWDGWMDEHPPVVLLSKGVNQ